MVGGVNRSRRVEARRPSGRRHPGDVLAHGASAEQTRLIPEVRQRDDHIAAHRRDPAVIADEAGRTREARTTVTANHAVPWVGSESTDVASAWVNERDPGDVSVATV